MKDIRQEFADTLTEVGREDQKLVVMVGDISHFRLVEFAKACPGRYYNVGICEPTIVNMGAGLAMSGLYPVMHTIAPFLIDRSYEQIKLDFCYQKLSGNLISVGSAFDYSTLGCSHHCYADFALLKPLPTTQIFFPASPAEFNRLFKQTYNTEKVNYFRLAKESHGLMLEPSSIVAGKGLVMRPGKDATIVVTGSQLKNALEAAKSLSTNGKDIEVIYLHTIKPFDAEIVVQSVKRTGKVLVVEEHSQFGGISDDVLRHCQRLGAYRFSCIAIKDEFIRGYGTYQDLCETVGLTAQNMVTKIKALF